MSKLKSLIEKGLGVLEEIGELSEVEDDNVISEAYKKVLEDLERLKYLAMEEDGGQKYDVRWQGSSGRSVLL